MDFIKPAKIMLQTRKEKKEKRGHASSPKDLQRNGPKTQFSKPLPGTKVGFAEEI